MKKLNQVILAVIFCIAMGFTFKVNYVNQKVMETYQEDSQVDEHLPAYKEFDSVLSVSAKNNKPILLYFTGHTVVNAKKMDMSILNDDQVSSFMKNNFIILELYVDDRKELPESDWITNQKTDEVLKTVGQQNQYIQNIKFDQNTQPFFVIMDHNEEVYGKTGYVPSIENFSIFLHESFDRINK